MIPLRTLLHFTNGTTTIDNDNTYGYEYTRKDKNNLLDIHVQVDAPYYTHLHIGRDYLTVHHKYITYYHCTDTVKIGNKLYKVEQYKGYESNIINEMKELAYEVINYNTAYGHKLIYMIADTIRDL